MKINLNPEVKKLKPEVTQCKVMQKGKKINGDKKALKKKDAEK
ncbi:hypothetical protein ACTQ5K_23945 [Niallia sp. Sow4_A1]|nr:MULTISPECIES: hypothetical protein [Bacillaceae]CAI9396720.1 hypothetical protein BACSP_04377 [Bacillus sp. T2.9-1]